MVAAALNFRFRREQGSALARCLQKGTYVLQTKGEEMEALILDLTEDQIVKTEFVEISGRLQDLAYQVSRLSQRQPDFLMHIKRIQLELRSVGGLLRGIE